MITGNSALQKTTSYKVVLPFYLYAAVAFLGGCIMLFLFTDAFYSHHFHPKTLAITHTMALGWGTMIILGASHQLVPVLIEGKLYSNALAYLTFFFAGSGIPLLVYGFYHFNMGWPVQVGGIAINLAVVFYLVNLGLSLAKCGSKNIHALFVCTAALWLFFTTLLGLLLALNFTMDVLDQNSLRYLSLHAHIGVAGWFLLLVLGVGSRLIPMFLISKYTNVALLRSVYGLVNLALVLFILFDVKAIAPGFQFIPASLAFSAILLFAFYCYKAYRERIRRLIDGPMKVSILSVVMLVLPFAALVAPILVAGLVSSKVNVAILYGFVIFFGWLTAIILGMTFKTLPFIVWNKVYHNRARTGKTPNPKDLFNGAVFKSAAIFYLAGFLLFSVGLILAIDLIVKSGAIALILTAFLYNINVLKIIFHKPIPQ